MPGEIAFAYVVYKDDTKRFLTVPIGNVKCKRNSKSHFQPTNADDFHKRQVYYVAWRDCDEECEEAHEHVGYYPAFILLLGENEEEIKRKAEEGRRLIIPHGVQSSESEENVQKSRKTKRNTATQDTQNRKNAEILKKYSQQKFLSTRNKLGDSDDESEVDENISAIHDSIDTDVDNMGTKSDGEKDNEVDGQRNRVHASTTKNVKDKTYTKLRMELQNKTKEIDDLRQMIQQLQDTQYGSQLSSITTDHTKSGRVTVRKNLFGRGDDEKVEGNDTGGGPHLNKVNIRRVEKVNLIAFGNVLKAKTDNQPLQRRERSNSPVKSNDIGLKKENIEEIYEKDRPSCSGISVRGVATWAINEENQVIKAGAAKNNQQELRQETRNLAENKNDNESTEDDSDHGDDSDRGDDREEIRAKKLLLELKTKRRRANNMNVKLDKKIIRDIDEALQFYEGQENDERGLKMYDVTGDRIYLGEGVRVSANTWFLIQHNKPSIFFRDMIELLWGQRKLVNRCQNPSKVTTKLQDRSPMKPLTPAKKRLAYKLYSDHLDSKKFKPAEKMKFMLAVPLLYSRKINDLRSKYYK